jgi:hypothetical protein
MAEKCVEETQLTPEHVNSWFWWSHTCTTKRSMVVSDIYLYYKALHGCFRYLPAVVKQTQTVKRWTTPATIRTKTWLAFSTYGINCVSTTKAHARLHVSKNVFLVFSVSIPIIGWRYVGKQAISSQNVNHFYNSRSEVSFSLSFVCLSINHTEWVEVCGRDTAYTSACSLLILMITCTTKRFLFVSDVSMHCDAIFLKWWTMP